MSAAQLADSPSRRDGVTEEVEQKCRLCGCSLMRAMAKGLEFNHETTATAMEFFHRFYARQSYAHHDYSVGAGMCGAWLSMLTTSLLCACLCVCCCNQMTALGCIFLAGKAQEEVRRLKQILEHARRTMQLNLSASEEVLSIN